MAKAPPHVTVRGLDQRFERGLVDRGIRPKLDVSHEPAAALQQACGIRELGAVEEADIDVRGESVHIGERRVADAGGWLAIMQNLAHIVTASTQDTEPVGRDRAEFILMRAQPGGDVDVSSHGIWQSKQPAHD